MATRSTITVVNPDDTVSQIYCHFDGYPAHNGVLLKEFYNTLELAQELVSLGDLSVLAERIHPEGDHTFEAPEDGTCVFYGRDRGESDTEPSHYPNFEMYRLSGDSQEYNYILRNDGKWYVRSGRDFVELDDLLETSVDTTV